MKRELLAYLACPHCSSNLKLQEVVEATLLESGREEIMTAVLQCASGHTYPVKAGVPRLVASELSGRVDLHTGKKFTESWKQFRRANEEIINEFFNCLAPLNRNFVRDKLVLDAGCGNGRHSRAVIECGARAVIAVDIGDSVDACYANLRDFENVHVVQGDIKALPVKPIFDFVFSTGVLHHMDDPRIGFRALAQKLNHAGTMAVWVYGRENNWWIVTFVDPLRKLISSRLPESILSMISTVLALIVHAASRNIYKPWHELRQTADFLPPLFYEAYLSYISRFDLEEIEHIVHDHLVAPIAYYLPREEVKSWGASGQFPFQYIRWHNQNSWTLVVSKDASARKEIDGRLDHLRELRTAESDVQVRVGSA